MRRRRNRKRGRKVVLAFCLILVGIEVFSTAFALWFKSRPHVTAHDTLSSDKAVVVIPGFSNVADVAAENIVAKLLGRGVNVFVVNSAWVDTDNTQAMYDELREAIDARNVRAEKAGGKQITSMVILGGSYGGPMGYQLGGYLLEDDLPYGKVSLVMDGSFCTREQIRWPQWMLDGGRWARSTFLLTALKAIPWYLQTSQALDDVEPGLDMGRLRYHHWRMALFPAIGAASQVNFIRNFRPEPEAAAAFSETYYIVTPEDPLTDNEASVKCWREMALPDMKAIPAPWAAGKHDPMAEQPSALASIALRSMPK